jgi:NAD(P)-dependent dehydrogenase (short-subunit alcohol dehydrogenase family)
MILTNKNILVTGANRGIGAAIVRELLKHKVGKVYAGVRKTGSLPDFGDKRVVPLELDITNGKQVAAAAKTAKDVNVLINNAGIIHLGGLLDNAIEDARADMDTNYFGTLSVIRAFVPLLEKNGNGEGLIANISSIAGLSALPTIGGYSVTKFAVHGLTQALRGELAGRIHVTGIYPGPTDTDMAKGIQIDKTAPETTAQHIVAGLIAGDEYIFPDARAKEWGALWQHDPRALEKQFAVPSGNAAEKAA